MILPAAANYRHIQFPERYVFAASIRRQSLKLSLICHSHG